MKTELTAFILSSFMLVGCNLNFEFEKPQDSVFDVCYVNQVDTDLLLVSYKSGIVQDEIIIKRGRRKVFNNVTGKVGADGFIGAPFIRAPDSVLIIQDFEISSDVKKYKKYVKQGCEGIYTTVDNNCNEFWNDYVFFYGIKSKNSVERKWYSLNRGNFYYQYIFNESFFENSLKMYDYEKRGL